MKRLTASEARRVWFGLLDEVARGEVVVIERRGRRIVLRAESPPPDRDAPVEYASLLRVPDLEQAHTWSWEWTPRAAGLRLRRRRRTAR